MGLEWVRDNIEAFGGDSTAITTGGQSAGAMSLDYYAHSSLWGADPIVQGFIFESGQVSTLAPNSANKTNASWMNVTESVGCSGQADLVSCMKGVPMERLLEGVNQLASIGQPAFQVTVDDKVIFNETVYAAKDQSGELLRILTQPSLICNNNYEPGFFRFEAAASAQGQAYLNNQTLWDLVQLSVATCPAYFASAARANHSIPIWRYRYFGEWPNLELYPGSGAWHGSETVMIFGTAQSITNVSDSPAELGVTGLFMKAWDAFICDPENGLTIEMQWPKYQGGGTETLIALGLNDSSMQAYVDPAPSDHGCQQVEYESLYLL